jgi:POT family proton-dependent oligopeptide transporter
MNPSPAPGDERPASPARVERQPGVLYMLFATEAWERFSYYGMRAILVLYMVKGLSFTIEKASWVYGFYSAGVYLTPLIGGYLADRLLNYRRAILLGGAVMAVGQFCLASGSLPLFYIGLVTLAAGNGLFKPNISTIVGTLYRDGDPRRDAGFTIFYMGVNLGAFVSPLVCGQLLGENPHFGFSWGFRAAGVGMLIGGLTFLVGQRFLGSRGRTPRELRAIERAGTAHTPPAAVSAPLSSIERGRIGALLVLAAFVVFFWMAFEQAGSTMTLFADESTDRNVFGFEAKASLFQSVNPIFIILLAPLLSGLWEALARAGKEPSSPAKMALGLTFLGAGFVPLVVASSIAGAHGKASWAWLVATYFLHTIGELCLSPIGLSLVTKLAPKRHAALLMGTWFLANSLANFLVGATGALYGLMTHVQFFSFFLATSLGAAAVLFTLLKPIKRLMAGVA